MGKQTNRPSKPSTPNKQQPKSIPLKRGGNNGNKGITRPPSRPTPPKK